MGRKIWIMNHYASNMFFDQGGRHYAFAKYLKRLGEEPVIFCCNSVHNGNGLYFQGDSLWDVHMEKKIQVPFVFVKGRPYVGNGIGRILNMIDFYANVKVVAKEYVKTNGMPNIIYASSAHPLTLLAGIQLAKKYHVKCVCEIRDLWPESFVTYGILSKYNPMLVPMYLFEKKLYEFADELIFTMEGAYNYILKRGWAESIPQEKFHYINNGVDLEAFDYNKENYSIVDADLNNSEIFKVIYTGSIRRANNVGKILDIAKCFGDEKIKFLIYGSGDEVDKLKDRLKNEKIENVVLKGSVEKKYIPFIISNADVNIMDMQDNNDLFKYGISPNKLFEYFAAQKPIIMYQLNSFNPAVDFKVGFVANTMEEIVGIIKGIMNKDSKYYIPKERFKMASKAYSYEELVKNLIVLIEKLG